MQFAQNNGDISSDHSGVVPEIRDKNYEYNADFF